MTYRVNKTLLLDYALEGAKTLRGLYSGQLSDEEREEFDKDIEELEKRYKAALDAEEARSM